MKQQAELWEQVYLRGDQPTTCPKCGNRTHTILELQHINNQPIIHVCMTEKCKFTFVEENDDSDKI